MSRFTLSFTATVVVAVVALFGLARAQHHHCDAQGIRDHQFEALRACNVDAGVGVGADNALKGRGPYYDREARSSRATQTNFTFSNPLASQFFVDGAVIPEVNFDVGSSWSGLLPISGDQNETRKLFFWFFPPAPGGSFDDLVLWTSGGPGCSSLWGLLQGNGPINWNWGQAKPTANEHSWTKLSSVLWVEQPVGTGYSQGEPNIRNEDDLAAQLVGFLEQFLNIFSELKGKNFYLTGESYAGTYIPYIANYIYSNPGMLDLNLRGIWMGDPYISWFVTQSQIPAVDFVHKYEHVFGFNQTFMSELDRIADNCNYAGYAYKHVTYPPKGHFPLPGKDTFADSGCDVWSLIFRAALAINPGFDIYRIFDMYPIPWDVLGFPGSFPQAQTQVYFDRQDVKAAIHAPVNVTWEKCATKSVFPNGDGSLPPSFTVLPNVIEKSQRSVIMHGLADFILIAEGARIAIQNMTWNYMQGFQTPIADDGFIVDGIGAMGNTHTERGLTYYEVQLSGHMIPQFSPRAAFQGVQYLMGFRSTP
ncbi:hypothetical protein AX17_002180 [Amanita inopinata Kibby_2008]|nr:hypothetical protein AX17_002180 [Amanita inopinata Kibby_2008]